MSSDVFVVCRLEVILAERGMTLTELSRRTGITMANLSVLKTNKARAVRFTTVASLCATLGVAPGDLFVLGTDVVQTTAAEP